MFKKAVSWLVAIALAAFCANLLCFAYYRFPSTYNRTSGATDWIYAPDGWFVNMQEGYGWGTFDQNGYNNPPFDFDDPYVLLMGSSHAEAVQMPEEYRMSAVLNDCFEDEVFTYNMARAGNFFPDILKHFPAAIGEFPDSKAVIITLRTTDYSAQSFSSAMDQVCYDPSSAGSVLVQEEAVTMQKARGYIKEALPYLQLLKKQTEGIDWGFDGAFGFYQSKEAQPEWDAEGYQNALDDILALVRSEYENPIIVVYHPEVALQQDGTMEVVRDEKSYDIFVQACSANNIVFLDVGDAFLQAYEADYIVPYGFNNTSMGEGHLNIEGHRIVGEQLYDALKGLV